MALDEATAAFLGGMAATGVKPLHEMTPTEARTLGRSLVELYGPGPAVDRVVETVIPSDDGVEVGVRVLIPDAPRAVIVYFHGGGWVMGSLDEFDHFARRLAVDTQSTVVVVDYRLAPEWPYPAAAHDAWHALNWAAENRCAIAIDGAPLIVAGDSAGGNLAAVVSQRAVASGGPELALQALICPVTDADFERKSYLDPDNQLILSRATMDWYWTLYDPSGRARIQPGASPLRASSLAGLPPAIVITAEYDVLRDEAEAYAGRLADSGVEVSTRRFDGQIHDFVTLVHLPASGAGLEYLAREINQRLGLVVKSS